MRHFYLDVNRGEVGLHATDRCRATTAVHVRDTLAVYSVAVELGLEVLKVQGQVQNVGISQLRISH